MTTTEHLQRIKAKCEQLLVIASKRTPGKWQAWENTCNGQYENSRIRAETYRQMGYIQSKHEDAIFIASCAGSAEAGWKTTVATIDNLVATPEDLWVESEQSLADSIIAAWPEDSL